MPLKDGICFAFLKATPIAKWLLNFLVAKLLMFVHN